MDNLDQLLDKAKWSHLTKQEIAFVAKQVPKATGAHLYQLLHILGRANATEYEELVKAHLEYTEEPDIVGFSIKILCDYWCMAQKYLPDLKRLIQNNSWDEFEEARTRAIGISGYALRQVPDKDLRRTILTFLRDEGEDVFVRLMAYTALVTSLGRSTKDIPSPMFVDKYGFDVQKHVDPTVIAETERLIERGQ